MFDSLTILSLQGGWGLLLLKGLLVTFMLGIISLPLSLMVGLGLAYGQNSSSFFWRKSSIAFTTFFRSLPELLTLFIVYYGLPLLCHRILTVLGFSVGHIQISPFLAGIIALSLMASAFAGEMWMGVLNAIPKGQYEASKALGLPPLLSFYLVIFPQLWRLAIPGIVNVWLNLLKDTSLVSTIALTELMRQTQVAVATTKEPLVLYGAACLLYLCLALISGFIAQKCERFAQRTTDRSRA
jgi:polar amino acid transport system permease protein